MLFGAGDRAFTYDDLERLTDAGTISLPETYTYDPRTGRFLQQDPLGFGAGDLNLYRNVSNNPVNWVDPTGLEALVFGDDIYSPAGPTEFGKGIGSYFEGLGNFGRQIRRRVIPESKIEAARVQIEDTIIDELMKKFFNDSEFRSDVVNSRPVAKVW